MAGFQVEELQPQDPARWLPCLARRTFGGMWDGTDPKTGKHTGGAFVLLGCGKGLFPRRDRREKHALLQPSHCERCPAREDPSNA